MLVNSIKPINSYTRAENTKGSAPRERRNAYEHNRAERENLNQINTTIRNNSDGRVSFKGGAPMLHKIATFASSNPLVAEALFAIIITCGLRPATIMATARTEQEKEKCSYQAAKSVSSGVVGLGTTALIGTPIAAAIKKAGENKVFEMPPEMRAKSQEVVNKGIEALKKLTETNADEELVSWVSKLIKDTGKIDIKSFAKKGAESQKAFTEKVAEKAPEFLDDIQKALKEQRVINNYKDTTKNVLTKLFQPVFMPIRAMITIAMVPIILNMLGLKKPAKKPVAPEQNPQVMLNYNVFQTDKEKELFNAFTEVSKNAN